MHNPTFDALDFPSLSAVQLQVLLGECADLTLLLSNDLIVADILSSPDFDADELQEWKGQKFESLIAVDSMVKLEPLLHDNAATEGSETPWRHLNFIMNGTPDLPLLVKFFRFANEGSAHHWICARDLRPMMDVQRRFMRMETTMLKQQQSESKSADHDNQPWKIVADVVAEIASFRVDQEAMDTLASILRLCVIEALNDADGDEQKAAKLLNIPVEKLRGQLRTS